MLNDADWTALRDATVVDRIRNEFVAVVGDPDDDASAHDLERAQLLAAAPRMLRALQAVIACTGGPEHWDGETRDALRMVEDAINHATQPL